MLNCRYLQQEKPQKFVEICSWNIKSIRRFHSILWLSYKSWTVAIFNRKRTTMKEIVTWSLSVNPENYHYPQTNRDWQRLRLLGIIFPDDCKISGVHQSFAAICLQTKFEAEKNAIQFRLNEIKCFRIFFKRNLS